MDRLLRSSGNSSKASCPCSLESQEPVEHRGPSVRVCGCLSTTTTPAGDLPIDGYVVDECAYIWIEDMLEEELEGSKLDTLIYPDPEAPNRRGK